MWNNVAIVWSQEDKQSILGYMTNAHKTLSLSVKIDKQKFVYQSSVHEVATVCTIEVIDSK